MPLRSATRRESPWIAFVSTPAVTPSAGPCTRSAITTSSKGVLPARSPIPLTASSTWRAPAGDRRQRVRRGEPQVVLTVEGEHRVRQARHLRPQPGAERTHRLGEREPHGVGHVDGARPGAQRRLGQLGDEGPVGARGVHRAELDVVGEVPGAGHHGRDHADDTLAGGAELVGELHVARVHEDVDARRRGAAQRLARRLDVLGHCAGQRADARVAHRARDTAHGLQLGARAHRKARLDDVDARRSEALGDLELVARAEGDARRLLAVAQRGVEDQDPIRSRHGRSLGRGGRSEAASGRSQKHETLSGRLGGRGFRASSRDRR